MFGRVKETPQNENTPFIQGALMELQKFMPTGLL